MSKRKRPSRRPSGRASGHARGSRGGLPPRAPRGASTDLAEIMRVADDIDAEVAALLSDDPALAMGSIPPGMVDADGEPVRLPVALFEPRRAVGLTQADGSRQELQAEYIIQSGFTRWRPLAVFDELPDWSVRQTDGGLELWDHGGLWARGPVKLDVAWLAAAARLGSVLAVYGVQVGVRAPEQGPWGPVERAAELRGARAAGIVAAALVPWQPQEPPEETIRYAGPTYDPATGRFRIGAGPDDRPVTWQLNTPGIGVEHGLIVGGPGAGKTNVVRVLNVEAIQTGRWMLWPADPTGRHNLPAVWSPAAERIAQTPAETVAMLAAADRIITTRLVHGGYTDPTPDKPAILLTIDEAQHVFAGNPQATALAERIATAGGPAGVALVVTTRGADLAYFGGSHALRTALARTNRYAAGADGLDLLAKLTT